MESNPHSKIIRSAEAARSASIISRLFAASRGMRRLLQRLLMFAFAAVFPAASPAATHLFVPGHGLTDRSSAVKSVQELIDECVATGEWMRIIEKEYDWGTLENDFLLAGGNPNNPAPQHRNWKTAGLNQIKADAELCAQYGKVLRVVLLHKYADFPAYMIGTAGGITLDRHTVEIASNTGGIPNRVIKLEQNDTQGVNTLGVLQGLYDKVIQTLKGSQNARRGFYGFVIQETSIGSTPYYDDTNDSEAVQRKSDWYANLRSFHDWLAPKLANFNSAGTTPYTEPGRLFWQMINSPYLEVQKIVNNFQGGFIDGVNYGAPLKGAGLCGPDTFPRESVATNSLGQPVESSLYKCYDQFIRRNPDRPVSLRVASSNYYTDRAFFLPTVIKGVQPIWTNTNLPAANGGDNKDAGDGIANFVGCVSIGNRPDNLDLHNVIWAWANGTLAAGDVDPGQPDGPWGWNQVKNWMKSSGQFPQTNVGGCRAALPNLIK